MFAAQPPNSRRMSGTRNATFRMCSLSGRMCALNRSGKTRIVSYATEPQIKAAFPPRISSTIQHPPEIKPVFYKQTHALRPQKAARDVQTAPVAGRDLGPDPFF